MNTDINTPGTVTIGGDLTVGNIGYGAMQLTGPKVWGEYPDHDKGVALLREVVAEGVTFIDTADVYGPHSNEELIKGGAAPLPGQPRHRHRRAASSAAAPNTATWVATRQQVVSTPSRVHEHAAPRPSSRSTSTTCTLSSLHRHALRGRCRDAGLG